MASLMASLQTASTVLVRIISVVFNALHFITFPLRFPLYYIYRLLAFLLSPLWTMASGASHMVLLVAHFVARLKVRLLCL
jgi:hypothetical protein